ncbi:MAG: hypothetical protein VX519_10865 [Myxococcota bacterium]|nr:hypothetical protein [Myxococcota bacterium]
MTFWMAALLLACSGGKDDSGTDDTAEPGPTGCRATPQPPDRDRLVVISHPYDADGLPASTWRTLTLTADGALEFTGNTFEMGRATDGEVVFTPDGSVGMVAHKDGSIGSFRVSDDGQVEMANFSYRDDFYASRVIPDATGEHVWIVDPNWPVNGGGIYRADISCENGMLSGAELMFESKVAADFLIQENQAIIVGQEVPGTNTGDDVALVDLDTLGDAISAADAFGDDEANMADATLAGDGQFVLVADNSEFSGIPNRIAVAQLTGDTLVASGIIEDVYDPVVLMDSPFGDTVLVLSGYGDALFVLEAGGSTGFSLRGELSYADSNPALPTAAAMVRNGPLSGHVIVTENQGLKQVQMSAGGVVEDWGTTSLGEGFTVIPGAIGIQP